jgi:TPR repeat protein
VIVSIVGCGPSLRSDTQDQPKAADATGRVGVAAIEGPTSPLIVDWNPEQRGDLEEAIQDGVAVVAYDKKGMRLLKRCKVSGDYGYIGMTTKTQVVRLESAEDVALNLPLTGASIAGNIGAELSQGATLDIALVMVGKKRTTWNEVTVKDLEGGDRCAGATHYVRGITVGAFAMGTGTKQKARAAAEIFGIGASAGASESSKVNNTDGKLTDCDKADPDSEKPPSQCQALLRVELEPIAKKASEPKEKPEEGAGKEQKPEVEATERIDCGPGKVFIDGKCTAPKANVAHTCKPDDASDCKAQCDKGDAKSCDFYGVLVSRGKVSGVDAKEAVAIFDKGCQKGSPSACVNFGLRTMGSDRDKSIATLEKACRDGESRGCSFAAMAYRGKDEEKAAKLLVAGCNGGDHSACVTAAIMYSGGSKTLPKDEKKALMLNMRACNGGVGTACANAGESHELGIGTPANPTEAARLYTRGCMMSPSSCWGIGILSQIGSPGVAKSDERAKDYYKRSCQGGFGGVQTMACFLLKAIYKEKEPRPINKASFIGSMQYMQPLCDRGMVRACVFVGVMQLAQDQKIQGEMTLRKACGQRDAWACDTMKRLGIR